MDYLKNVLLNSTGFFTQPRTLGFRHIVSLPGAENTTVNKFLLCTSCEKYALPMVSMCKKGHPLCDSCFQDPELTYCTYMDENGKGCGGIFLNNLPMRLYEYMHQNSIFHCQNRERGCTEDVLGENLAEHVDSLCEFRDLKQCVYPKCSMLNPALNDYYNHLVYDHEVGNIEGPVADFVVRYDDPKFKKRVTSSPFVLSVYGAQFMVILHKVENRIAMWMATICKPPGSRFKATFMIVHNEKYLSKQHNVNNKMRSAFHETHSLSKPFTDIMDLGECLEVTRSAIESNFLMEDPNGDGRIWCIGVLIEGI